MKVFIPRDNVMSINMLTIVESLVLKNRVANEAITTLFGCEKMLKMMSIGMEEYTLDFIIALPNFTSFLWEII